MRSTSLIRLSAIVCAAPFILSAFWIARVLLLSYVAIALSANAFNIVCVPSGVVIVGNDAVNSSSAFKTCLLSAYSLRI